MSTLDYIYPIIIPSDSDIKEAFSSTNTPDYTPASPDYSPASLGNTSSDPSEDLSKDLLASLAISPFHNDPYMKEDKIEGLVMFRVSYSVIFKPIAHRYFRSRTQISGFQREQIRHDDEIVLASVRISTLEMIIEDIQVTMALLPPGFLKPLYLDMINAQDIEHMIPPTPPRDIEPPVGSPISLSPSSLIIVYGSTATTVERNQSENLMRRLVSNKMAPKRTSTSAAPAMTQAAIRKLVVDSVAAALEAQATTIANTDNTNKNIGQGETHVARKCSYKEFMSCQPFNFKGTEGVVGLIRWFERTK
ncbi:hypothetical protein Tco_0746604 [Tanacetum coccineum]